MRQVELGIILFIYLKVENFLHVAFNVVVVSEVRRIIFVFKLVVAIIFEVEWLFNVIFEVFIRIIL